MFGDVRYVLHIAESLSLQTGGFFYLFSTDILYETVTTIQKYWNYGAC